jgi:hypothetical protein
LAPCSIKGRYSDAGFITVEGLLGPIAGGDLLIRFRLSRHRGGLQLLPQWVDSSQQR